MAQKQDSALVGGPGGEAPRELLHFDVLGTQFHGSKACKMFCYKTILSVFCLTPQVSTVLSMISQF
jgi:hypothetical protein